jgi:hypothetical protein
MKEILSKAKISVPDPPLYRTAKKSPTSESTYFEDADTASGDDQYVNNYMVKFLNSKTSITITFSGYFRCYKNAKKDMTVCQAERWAPGYASWTADITITQSKDSNGNSILSVQSLSPTILKSGSDSGKNTCAEVWEFITLTLTSGYNIAVGLIVAVGRSVPSDPASLP